MGIVTRSNNLKGIAERLNRLAGKLDDTTPLMAKLADAAVKALDVPAGSQMDADAGLMRMAFQQVRVTDRYAGIGDKQILTDAWKNGGAAKNTIGSFIRFMLENQLGFVVRPGQHNKITTRERRVRSRETRQAQKLAQARRTRKTTLAKGRRAVNLRQGKRATSQELLAEFHTELGKYHEQYKIHKGSADSGSLIELMYGRSRPSTYFGKKSVAYATTFKEQRTEIRRYFNKRIAATKDVHERAALIATREHVARDFGWGAGEHGKYSKRIERKADAARKTALANEKRATKKFNAQAKKNATQAAKLRGKDKTSISEMFVKKGTGMTKAQLEAAHQKAEGAFVPAQAAGKVVKPTKVQNPSKVKAPPKPTRVELKSVPLKHSNVNMVKSYNKLNQMQQASFNRERYEITAYRTRQDIARAARIKFHTEGWKAFKVRVNK